MIYVFDLDDTLCNTPFGIGPDGREGPQYYDATPKIERISVVNKLHDAGHTIIIETARGSSGRDWFKFTWNQLKSWGVKFHKLRTGVKFVADVYIDDKGKSDKDFFND